MSPRNWLRSWLPTATRTPARSRRLAVEPLEARDVPSAVAPPSGRVSWWTGDNTATDLMGLNNATLSNGTAYAAGEVGQAWSFDGVDDRAMLGDPDSLKFTASMTIEGWILVRAYPTIPNGAAIVFRGDSRPGLDPYTLGIGQGGTLNFGINSAQGGSGVSAPIPLGQLIHVAATLDDATGTMKLYENGVVVAQTVTALRPFRDLDPTQNPAVGIGNANSTYNIPLNGLIDELAFYNRALTPSEIRGIHAAGSAGKVKAANHIAADFPTVTEGASSATFTLTRVGSTSGQVVVNWATTDGTATAGTDYVAASGQVVFEAGETVKTVTIDLVGDATPEAAETFWLTLSTPTSGWEAGSGLATITDDDVGISVSDSTAVEGSSTLKVLDRFVAESSGGLLTAKGCVFGPDGNGDGTQDLYVSSGDADAILRYDGVTGAFIDTFIPSGFGGLDNPVGLAFDSADRLYVSTGGPISAPPGKVFRYEADGSNPVVVASGLTRTLGLAFGPDGSLFIADADTDQVLRYDGSGLSAFISAGSGGLDHPFGVEFGPDGNLYVASHNTGQVLRYSGTTGAFLGVFATTNLGQGPFWLQFGTDGYLYTTVRTSGTALATSFVRFDASTGAFVDRLDLGRDGWAFTLGADNLVYHSSNSSGSYVERIGPSNLAAFTVSLSSASATEVTVDFTTVSGSATAGSDFTPIAGTLTFAPGQTTRTVLVPTLNDAGAEANESFALGLSNAVGAAITDGIGDGTITDDESATKFFVVDDASTDRTYRYHATGTAQATTTLGSGNTAPRGAASTAAGDTVWVVDANKKVYVYSAAGGLLGSWTPGSLASNATLEGITVWGTDVWLVDARQDRVFKYVGAATRLSGSQNAASIGSGSFNLNSGNSSPKDLVTDGTSIWVVNDSTTDKVFKYELAGGLQGSWTLTGGGGKPTGITLDPSAPAHLWVVDNATDRVYQYDNAVGRTSGSQAASTTFALAAGNTNPQGIADPPVPAPEWGVRLPAVAGVTWLAAPAGRDPVTGPEVVSPRPVPMKVSVAGSDTPPRGRELPRREAVPPPAGPVAGVAADWLTDAALDFRPIAVDLPRVKVGRR